MKAQDVQQTLRKLARKDYAERAQQFFKTGPGEYGEGDIFIGIRVPQLRKTARTYKELSFGETRKLLRSPIHEERLTALFILVHQFEGGDENARKRIFDLYLKSTKHINNWDLVDLSAHKIVGVYLENRSTRLLDELARSKDLWERRIAVLATFHFIRLDRFAECLRIARILRDDDHDLIHKAVGWMLREIGNRARSVEESFLKKHYRKMPRTMLRYAIERFPEKRRLGYLGGTV